MGLIAREVEARGIPTLSLSSAYSITRAVNPPRAAYVDYPLGHTSGKPNDQTDQLRIMRSALGAFATLDTAGEIHLIEGDWQPDHGWKDRVMRPRPPTDEKVQATKHDDTRVARHATPQYQNVEDENAADQDCPTCIFLD